MKAKKLYKEGQYAVGGYNPCDDDSVTVFKYGDKFYCHHHWLNYTTRGDVIKEVTAPKALPQEYEKKEVDQYGKGKVYYLYHINSEEDLPLTKFDKDNIPLSLMELYMEELTSMAKKKFENYYGSQEDLLSGITNPAEKRKASLLISVIISEMSKDKYIEVYWYQDILENLPEIVSGDYSIVTFSEGDECSRFTIDQIVNRPRSCTFATSGSHLDYCWGRGRIYPRVENTKAILVFKKEFGRRAAQISKKTGVDWNYAKRVIRDMPNASDSEVASFIRKQKKLAKRYNIPLSVISVVVRYSSDDTDGEILNFIENLPKNRKIAVNYIKPNCELAKTIKREFEWRWPEEDILDYYFGDGFCRMIDDRPEWYKSTILKYIFEEE